VAVRAVVVDVMEKMDSVTTNLSFAISSSFGQEAEGRAKLPGQGNKKEREWRIHSSSRLLSLYPCPVG